MKVYPKEILDGLSEVIKAQASIAYCAPATLVKADDVKRDGLELDFLKKITASSNPNQIDLYYLKSILVSTGWNKNDDVFDPRLTWAARNTPEDKQFNFMHDENDIIGHITGSYVIDREGNRIPEDVTDIPSDFDIVTEAVLYNSWNDPKNKERMQQIIAEIEDGKWFVSMECIFAGFDYAVATGSEIKIVTRSEESAFLTKHLRAYGGTGEYEGYKIGRVLREIAFSGKGLVSRPANPRSVIFDSSQATALNTNESTESSVSTGDNNMSDTNHEATIAELQSKIDAAKAEAETVSKEYAEKISTLEATLAEKDGAIKSFEDKIAALEASLAAKETEFSELSASFKEMKKSEKNRDRKDKLVKAGFEDVEAEESLASYDALSDEAFEAVVATIAKKFAALKGQATVTEPEGEAGTSTEAGEAGSTEEGSDAATAGLFNDVQSDEAPLTNASTGDDELEATRASVASWLSETVLNSNSK